MTHISESRHALDIAYAVATGTDFGGRFKAPSPGPVLFLSCDCEESDLRRRFQDVMDLPKPPRIEDLDRFHSLSMLGQNMPNVDHIIDYANYVGAVLVVLDLALSWPNAHRICSGTGSAVLMVQKKLYISDNLSIIDLTEATNQTKRKQR